jgi:nucleoside-diphosphate-sugar epimerase
MITTDKVYENKEWVWAYRENDELGGYDPYSTSKACAELVIRSYIRSFFNVKDYGKKHNTFSVRFSFMFISIVCTSLSRSSMAFLICSIGFINRL